MGTGKNKEKDLLSYENTYITRIVKNGYLQGGDLYKKTGSPSNRII